MIYGTDDLRTMKERYSYFMRGRQLVIIEHKIFSDVGVDNSPPYQAPTGGTDALDGSNEGKTGRGDSLMLEYTAIPDVADLLNENAEIPIHDTMALAIVDYIKAQLVEDPRNFKMKEYYMGRFNKRIAEYTNARVGGLRRVQGKAF
tara:strand:+ start:3174 stop:3611 length:438 start_codon:yes stop_codon:yes gene_type:complete